MILYNVKQRSKEWFEIKKGILSSSDCEKIMRPRGLGKGGEKYCVKLAGEIFTEHYEEKYVSKAMRDGIIREPIAKEIYEEQKMVSAKEAGFCVFESEIPELSYLNGFLGCSPDALIGEKGGLEIKCPDYTQHSKNLALNKWWDNDYHDQIQQNLFVTDRDWWDLISFNPDFKDGYKWVIIRNYIDQDWRDLFIERAKLCKRKVEQIRKNIQK